MAINEIKARKQSPAMPRYELNPDIKAGLAQAVENSQPLMALVYIDKLFENYEQRIDLLEQEVAALVNQLQKLNADKSKPISPKKTTGDGETVS